MEEVQITQKIKDDPELYYVFQANIAMAFVDEYARSEKRYKNRGEIHQIANQAAKNFLNLWISSDTAGQGGLPAIDEAGKIAATIAEKVEPELTAREQAYFVAGFQECIKLLTRVFDTR